MLQIGPMTLLMFSHSYSDFCSISREITWVLDESQNEALVGADDVVDIVVTSVDSGRSNGNVGDELKQSDVDIKYLPLALSG